VSVNGELAPDLIERVLAALGMSRTPAPDFSGLGAVYGAWCRRVPFDNIRKRIHVQSQAASAFPGDTAEDFFNAWLKYRTGGTCWAGNGALCTLLDSIGFAARRGVGTMLARPDIPPNHGTVLVELDGKTYVVDASILHLEPLVLDERKATTIDHRAWGVACAKRDGHWYIRWRPLHAPDGFDCRIDRLSSTRQEFQERHEQTRAWSPFNYELNARLIRGESMVGITLGRRIEFDAKGAHLERELTGDERKRVLVDEVGIGEEIVDQLPPDRPTPPPPGSRTAALRQ
jgi:arylamine N-acetyltransferase